MNSSSRGADRNSGLKILWADGERVFCRGESDGDGAGVLVVRPGFVRTRMTEGRAAAPLAVGPDQVAEAVEAGILAGRRVVWVPAPMRLVSGVLRALPGPLFRRLPI